MAFRVFAPIVAGATLRDRLAACLGAFVSIAVTGAVCGLSLGEGYDVPLIVAPMGASAVLLFAIPASPLAQPWPIIGGNTISAAIGLIFAQLVYDPVLAAALAVASAIAVMSLTRCLHPPGGAAALTAALGGPAVVSAGWLFPFVPVAVNSILMVAVGICFHRLARRKYPHSPAPPIGVHGTNDPPPETRAGFRSEDVDTALAVLDEAYDIDRTDLERLLRQVEYQAFLRSNQSLLCVDIMSRDIIRIEPETTAKEAVRLLLEHSIRTVPIIDQSGRLLGTVGLRELATAEGQAAQFRTAPATASPQSQALALLPILTDGRTHAVIIVDDGAVVGIVTQTDLLAATTGLRREYRKLRTDPTANYEI